MTKKKQSEITLNSTTLNPWQPKKSVSSRYANSIVDPKLYSTYSISQGPVISGLDQALHTIRQEIGLPIVELEKQIEGMLVLGEFISSTRDFKFNGQSK